MRTAFRNLLKFLLVIFVLLLLVGSIFQLNARLAEQDRAADFAPDNGHFIKTELGQLHVTVWGAPDDIPIVMTHGMAAWGGLWEQTATQLAQKGYRVIAVDLPPFGFSERSNKNFSRSLQAKQVHALATTMGLDNYFLVGHSYGGGVAMETALRTPEKIAGLVLVCPVLNISPEGETPTLGDVPLPLRSAWFSELLVSSTITNPLMTGTLTKLFMHNKNALTQRHIEILQRPMSRAGNTANMVVWLQQFLKGDPNAKSRNRADLKQLKTPISLIWGTNDTVTPIEQGDTLAKLVQPQRFTRLDGIGHMPQLEKADFANDLITALRELQTRAR